MQQTELSEIQPNNIFQASKGTFLSDVQIKTIEMYKDFLREKDGQAFGETQIGFVIEQGKNFICHLETTPDKTTCKDEFAKVFSSVLIKQILIL